MPENESRQCTSRIPALIIVCTLVIFFIMTIAQEVVGIVYRNDCPGQPLIPVYFIGALPVCMMVYGCWKCNMYLSIAIFLSWFPVGTVWIYSAYEPNYDKNNTTTGPYCSKVLYLFAFWTTNLTYLLLGVMLFSCCRYVLHEPNNNDDEWQTLFQGADGGFDVSYDVSYDPDFGDSWSLASHDHD